MKREHLSYVRIEKIGPDIKMTRIGTHRLYSLITKRGPLTKRMRPGEVWSIRWYSTGAKRVRGACFATPHAVLVHAQPILSAWLY